MKYRPDCVLSVISPSACMGTIWQMPLIVSPLVPEGRYCYPEILFLWIKKPQYIQYCPIVLLWPNNWIILFFLGSSPIFAHLPIDVEAKNASQVWRERCSQALLCPYRSPSPPIFIPDTLPTHSVCCPLWSPWASFSFCVFAGHRPSCTSGFFFVCFGFGLQSNTLYIKPIKLHPWCVRSVEFQDSLTTYIMDF